MASTRARWSGSPARLTVRTEAGRVPSATSSFIADGTVLIRVTSPVPACSATPRASSASTIRPPVESVRKISKTDRSKQTDVPARTPESSSAAKSSAAQSIMAPAAPWEMATPFGRPVEPEV